MTLESSWSQDPPQTGRAARRRRADGSRFRQRRCKPAAKAGIVQDIVSSSKVKPATAFKDKWWRSLGLWAIDTANPNSWTTARQDVFPCSAADIFRVQ